jgi:hypothetical protein
MLVEELAQLVAAVSVAAEAAPAEAAGLVVVRAAAQDPDAPWTAVEAAGAAARPSRRRC